MQNGHLVHIIRTLKGPLVIKGDRWICAVGSLFARSLSPDPLITLEYEVCSCSFHATFIWSEWVSTKARQHPYFSTSTLLKWNWKISLVFLNTHSASNKYATVWPLSERQRESFTPRHIWSLDFTNYISCFYASLPKKWVTVWILPQPSKSNGSWGKARCDLGHTENSFYSRTLRSFFSNQEPKPESTEAVLFLGLSSQALFMHSASHALLPGRLLRNIARKTYIPSPSTHGPLSGHFF